MKSSFQLSSPHALNDTGKSSSVKGGYPAEIPPDTTKDPEVSGFYFRFEVEVFFQL